MTVLTTQGAFCDFAPHHSQSRRVWQTLYSVVGPGPRSRRDLRLLASPGHQ